MLLLIPHIILDCNSTLFSKKIILRYASHPRSVLLLFLITLGLINTHQWRNSWVSIIGFRNVAGWFFTKKYQCMHMHAQKHIQTNGNISMSVVWHVTGGDLMDMDKNSLLRTAVWSPLNAQLKLVKMHMAWQS